MELDLDDDGNVTAFPVVGFDTLPAMGTTVLARIEYPENPEQMRTGTVKGFQISMTPRQALDIAAALTRQARRILDGRDPPAGTA